VNKNKCKLIGVAAFMCLLGCGGGITADTILYNGNIITVDSDFTIAEAVAIAGGKILRVGDNDDIRKLASGTTKQIDLEGKTVTTGFIDTHPHMIHVGSRIDTNLSLVGVGSVAEMKERIAKEVESTPEGDWIFTTSIGGPPEVRDLPGALKEGRWPNRADLDEAAPDNPVYIPTPWGGPKPAVLDSQALSIMGITKDTPTFDKGIQIVKDDETGEPTGLIIGMHAYNWNPYYYGKISGFAPKFPVEKLADGLERHIQDFNSRGLTAVYESHRVTEENVATVKTLLDNDRLNIRMKLALEVGGAQWQPAEQIDSWFKALKSKHEDASFVAEGEDFLALDGGDKVQMLGATLSSDGPISFGRAMLNVPYVDMEGRPGSEKLPISVERIKEVSLLAAKNDIRMNFPVGGDRMADAVLEALEDVNEVYPLQGKNWVLVHAAYMTKERLQRMKALGLHHTSNSNSEYKLTKARYEEIYGELAEERAAIYTPWRWILDSGVPAAHSTDNVFAYPMFSLWQALTRGSEAAGESLMSPGKKITREEGIRLQTIHAAKILMWDDEIGSIEAGKLADLVILDTDILTCPQDDIKATRVLATLLGGELVHGSL